MASEMWVVARLSVMGFIAICTACTRTDTSSGPASDGGAPTDGGEGLDGGAWDAGASPIPACGDAGPTFTNLPIAINEFFAFRALGFLSPPIHMFPAKHSAFTINIPDSGIAYRAVSFPGRAWVTDITSTRQASFDGGAIDGGTGFQLSFYPCTEFKAYFYHLGTLSDALLTTFNNASAKSCSVLYAGDGYGIEKCVATGLSHAIDAGEFVGISDGFAGVDFGAVDMRGPPQPFIVPSHYSYDYPYYVSPVLWFTEPARSQLMAKIGSYDGTAFRTAPPVVGSYMPDLNRPARQTVISAR